MRPFGDTKADQAEAWRISFEENTVYWLRYVIWIENLGAMTCFQQLTRPLEKRYGLVRLLIEQKGIGHSKE